MSENFKGNVYILGSHRIVGDSILTGCDKDQVNPADLIGYCPLFTELTWTMLTHSFREQRGLTRQDRLSDNFGDGVFFKDDFLSLLPESLKPGGYERPPLNEYDGFPAMEKIVRRDLSKMDDNWKTVRSVISVVKLADRLFYYSPNNVRKCGESFFEVAASYFRGHLRPIVRKY
ncbi:hypothetical protein ACMC9M_08470 [Pseudomonadota bacterium 24LQ007]